MQFIQVSFSIILLGYVFLGKVFYYYWIATQLERMADQTQVGKLEVGDHGDPEKTEEKSDEGRNSPKNEKKKKKKSKKKATKENDSLV